ncbi:MAG: nicotinamide mononucleotide transporter [Ruminococcaceae bacterium]|nr:nicotinamide mononucleotide transporter [Oscillospiraceae bacterium]
MLYNPFRGLSRREWCLYLVSLAVVLISNFVSGAPDPVNLLGTVIGVTVLILAAKGDVWSQVLAILFSIFYAITSYRFAYYGEMITYLGMSAPIALLSVISWLKNPYQKGEHEVKIHRLTKKQTAWMLLLTVPVTVLFYFLLKMFGTANLPISTVSVTTSFLASCLLLLRSSYYALAYAANDLVLITLWILATIEDLSFLPMIFCFVMFLINDLYGFVSWKHREKRQIDA